MQRQRRSFVSKGRMSFCGYRIAPKKTPVTDRWTPARPRCLPPLGTCGEHSACEDRTAIQTTAQSKHDFKCIDSIYVNNFTGRYGFRSYSRVALQRYWSGYRPITFTRMFEPRHNILSIVRTRAFVKYVVTWLEHSA